MHTFVERLFKCKIMEAQEKRDFIIRKCYKLLLLKGFDGVSISDIQKECGVARGLLYHYFGSKEELFYEVVSNIILPQFIISKSQVSNLNLRDTLLYICNQHHQICLTDELQGVSLLNYDFLIYRTTQESPLIGKQYEEIRKQEQEVVIGGIERSIANGEMRADVNHAELAQLITSLIDGTWLNALSQGDPELLITQLKKMVALNLHLLNHK